jgi:hypothetical protein
MLEDIVRKDILAHSGLPRCLFSRDMADSNIKTIDSGCAVIGST